MRPPLDYGVTPDQITTLSLAVGLLAAWLYAPGGAAAQSVAPASCSSIWLDHTHGELARMTGRTSAFGHYHDSGGGAVLVALFVGIGIGLQDDEPAAGRSGSASARGWRPRLIFALRLELERRAGKAATRQPNLLGFEVEDVMYLVGPVTWLGLVQPLLVLAGIGAPGFALLVLWQGRGVLLEQRT